MEKLKHGWFVVKNRSTQETQDGVTLEGRREREQMFFTLTAPWDELSKSRIGIEKVKSHLDHLLYNHIRREFPKNV